MLPLQEKSSGNVSVFVAAVSVSLGSNPSWLNRRIIETKETPFAFLSAPVAWRRQRLPLLDFGRGGIMSRKVSVGQLTLNQRVVGSSPTAPTNRIKILAQKMQRANPSSKHIVSTPSLTGRIERLGLS
jgi:hypothetical protein